MANIQFSDDEQCDIQAALRDRIEYIRAYLATGDVPPVVVERYRAEIDRQQAIYVRLTGSPWL